MEREIWKDVEGYEGKYQVSDCGNVKSLIMNKLLGQSVSYQKYDVGLVDNNKIRKRYPVDYLVAKTFIENDDPTNKIHIKHLDGNKLNNKANNLQWITELEKGFVDYPDDRKIIQYDKNGNTIKVWTNLREIVIINKDYEKGTIRHNISKNSITAYDYIWRYENDTDIKPKEKPEDEINLLDDDVYDFDRTKEYWKNVRGFEKRYRISSFGKVKSLATNELMTIFIKTKYYSIMLYTGIIKSKMFRVHRLLAQHFIFNLYPETHKIIDHIDNNKLNNDINNLRWVTYRKNRTAYIKNFKPKRKILQHDLSDNLIKEWDSINDLIKKNKNYKIRSIRYALRLNTVIYKHKWKYADGIHVTKQIKKIVIEADEEFKNIGIIKGYDFSNYEISNYGKIKNIKTKQFLNPAIRNDYYDVHLKDKQTKKDKTMYVHKLIAYAFIEKPIDKNYVNHIDENKLNNKIENLEWTTIRDNTIHSIGIKVHQLDPITNQIIKKFNTMKEICQYLNNTKANKHIHKCCKGERDLYANFKWQYA